MSSSKFTSLSAPVSRGLFLHSATERLPVPPLDAHTALDLSTRASKVMDKPEVPGSSASPVA